METKKLVARFRGMIKSRCIIQAPSLFLLGFLQMEEPRPIGLLYEQMEEKRKVNAFHGSYEICTGVDHLTNNLILQNWQRRKRGKRQRCWRCRSCHYHYWSFHDAVVQVRIMKGSCFVWDLCPWAPSGRK